MLIKREYSFTSHEGLLSYLLKVQAALGHWVQRVRCKFWCLKHLQTQSNREWKHAVHCCNIFHVNNVWTDIIFCNGRDDYWEQWVFISWNLPISQIKTHNYIYFFSGLQFTSTLVWDLLSVLHFWQFHTPNKLIGYDSYAHPFRFHFIFSSDKLYKYVLPLCSLH